MFEKRLDKLERDVEQLRSLIVEQFVQTRRLIMSTSNSSGQALIAVEARIEASLGKLFDAISKELKDFADQLAAALKASGVPASTVDDMNVKFSTLTDKVDAMLATVVSADPGDVPASAPPPTPPPAPTA